MCCYGFRLWIEREKTRRARKGKHDDLGNVLGLRDDKAGQGVDDSRDDSDGGYDNVRYDAQGNLVSAGAGAGAGAGFGAKGKKGVS